jgi:hypothetical protein
MADTVTGTGTPDNPWVVRTPPGTSEYRMHRDDATDPPELVCQVGSTKLRYLARSLEDVPAMLETHGDWMELGSADENKPAKDGTLEAWARSDTNPVGGWYGLRKGYRGRFAVYVPPAARASRRRRARAQPAQQPDTSALRHVPDHPLDVELGGLARLVGALVHRN